MNNKALEVMQGLLDVSKTHLTMVYVHLPVLYSGGDCVCLEVDETKKGYLISDWNQGNVQAELQAGDIKLDVIKKIGEKTAKEHCVKFEFGSLRIEVKNINQLNSAICHVANASRVFCERLIESQNGKK